MLKVAISLREMRPSAKNLRPLRRGFVSRSETATLVVAAQTAYSSRSPRFNKDGENNQPKRSVPAAATAVADVSGDGCS